MFDLKFRTLLCSSVVVLALSACSDSNTSSVDADSGGIVTVNGGGVKGPLADAIVTVYRFDASQSGAGYRGANVGEGITDGKASIKGLGIDTNTHPLPYILEVTSHAGTIDLTTGAYPVIHTLRTVITQDLIDKKEQIYATPLTTMAVDLAIKQLADGTGTVDVAAFEAALQSAASQVISTVGFGLKDDVNIFDTPPLINDETDTAEEQENTAAYRTAVEALTAIVYEMEQLSQGEGDTNSVLSELVDDLADGNIDGQVNGNTSTILNAAARDVLKQDPDNMLIPGTDKKVSEVTAVLETEKAQTGSTTDTSAMASVVIVTQPAVTNSDLDNDGVLNASDAFPHDAAASKDFDKDGLPDDLVSGVATTLVADEDDDNDGAPDATDDFPLNAAEQADTDNDGIGNNADADDDGDGVADVDDAYPLDSSRSSIDDIDGDLWPNEYDDAPNDPAIPGTPFAESDPDRDGVPNSHDADDDNDGVPDVDDAFPLDSTEYLNTDASLPNGDALGDNADTDDDGDGVLDINDAFPKDNTEWLDTDRDGIGNNLDSDDDNDGWSDTKEALEGTDPLVRDSDGDGYLDNTDAFPLNPAESLDTDGDTVGNNADSDDDGDGLSDVDEAIHGSRSLVADTDGDTINDGDEVAAGTDPIKADTDDDSVNDNDDAFPNDPLETKDTDNDTVGDNADAFPNDPLETTDTDGDGVGDNGDAFPNDPEESVDTDLDGVGDEADAFPNDENESADADQDNVGDNADNCLDTANADQADTNGNGVGDACDAAPVASDFGSMVAPLDVAELGVRTFDVIAQALDAEGDAITILSVTTPSKGDVTETNGVLTYTPSGLGLDSFSYTISDGGQTDTGMIYVNVIQNEAPVIPGVSLTVDEDGTVTTGNVLSGASDAEDDSISIKSADSLSAHGGVVLNHGDGTFTYSPVADFNGTDSFSILATDGSNEVSVPVNVTVTAQNDAPTISATPLTSVVEGASYSFNVSAGDADLADVGSTEVLAFSITGNPAWMSIDPATGVVSGTATGLGLTSNIVITVTDVAGASASLGAFSVDVVEASQVLVSGVFNASVVDTGQSMMSAQGGLSCLNPDYVAGTRSEIVIIEVDEAAGTLSIMGVDGERGDNGTYNPATGAVSVFAEEYSNYDGVGPNGGILSTSTAFSASGTYDAATGVLSMNWEDNSTLVESGMYNPVTMTDDMTYTAECVESGTVEYSLHSSFLVTEILPAMEGGVYWMDWSYDDASNAEQAMYGMFGVAEGTATLYEPEYVHDLDTEAWVLDSSGYGGIELGSDGVWYVDDGSQSTEIAYTSATAATFTDVTELGVVLSEGSVQLHSADISGLPVTDFVGEAGPWAMWMIDPDAVMPTGSTVMGFESTLSATGMGRYELWDGQWDCPAEQYTLLNDSCNSIEVDTYNDVTFQWDTSYLSTLDQLLQPAPYDTSTSDSVGPVHTWVGDGVSAELLTDGRVLFYDHTVGRSNLSPMTETATWTRFQPTGAGGAEVITFTVPAEIADLWEYQGDRYVLLAEHNGYVRRGMVSLAGETEFHLGGIFNKTAMDAILANFQLTVLPVVPDIGLATAAPVTGPIDPSAITLSWTDAHSYWDGSEDVLLFEYGVFSSTVPEQIWDWDYATSSWVSDPRTVEFDDDYVLTATGWQIATENMTPETSLPTHTIFKQDELMDGSFASSRLSVAVQSSSSLAGQSIASYMAQDDSDWAPYIIPGSEFSAGALEYGIEYQYTVDGYRMENEPCLGDSSVNCARVSNPFGELPVADDGTQFFTGLNQILGTSMTVAWGYQGDTNTGYGIDFGGSTSGGTAKYYSHNFSTGENTLVDTGSWELVRVNGFHLMRFEVPATFADLYGGDAGWQILTEYDGYVRRGEYMSAGVVHSTTLFNDVALADVTAATDPSQLAYASTSVIGTGLDSSPPTPPVGTTDTGTVLSFYDMDSHQYWDGSHTNYRFDSSFIDVVNSAVIGQEYSSETGGWETDIPEPFIQLTPTGWAVGAENSVTFTANTTSEYLAITFPMDDGSVGPESYLAMSGVDVSGQTIVSYVEYDYAMGIDAAAVFSAGAVVYENDYVVGADSYELSTDNYYGHDYCFGNTAPAMCNSVIDFYAQIPTTIDTDLSNSATPFQSLVPFTSDSNMRLLMRDNSSTQHVVEFSGGPTAGVAVYGTVDKSDGSFSEIISAPWDVITRQGVEILRYEVPAEITSALYGAEEVEYRILSMYDGYLRHGDMRPAGDSDQWNGFNQIAFDDVMANFDPDWMVSCTDETLWDDASNQPFFDSYVEFEAVLSACGGVIAMTAEDVVGTWQESWYDSDAMVDRVNERKLLADGTGRYAEYVDTVEVVGSSFDWSINVDGMLVVTTLTGNMEVTALTAQGMKTYSEDIAWGSDLATLNGDAEGEFFMTDFGVRVSASGLAFNCVYETPWDDINDAPAEFNSFVEFNYVLASCGGGVALTEADFIGEWSDSTIDSLTGDVLTDQYTYNADGSGEYRSYTNDVLDVAAPLLWHINAEGMFVGEVIGSLGYKSVVAKIETGSYKTYTEAIEWGSDFSTLDSALEGEISNYSMGTRVLSD